MVPICTMAAIVLTTLAWAIAKPSSTYEVRPKVLIRGKEFTVPTVYPKELRGRLCRGKEVVEH